MVFLHDLTIGIIGMTLKMAFFGPHLENKPDNHKYCFSTTTKKSIGTVYKTLKGLFPKRNKTRKKLKTNLDLRSFN